MGWSRCFSHVAVYFATNKAATKTVSSFVFYHQILCRSDLLLWRL